MEGKYVIKLLLCISVLVLFACNSPLMKVTSPAVAPQAGLTAGTSIPSPAPAAEPEESSFTGVYLAGVDSGRWSKGEGLLALLRFITGQPGADQALGQVQIEDPEAGGLLRMTRQYLQQNPNAPEKAEMEKLLAALLPTAEQMMPYAAPEGQSQEPGTSKLASLPPGRVNQDQACTNLFDEGFPPPRPGEAPLVCVLYRTFSAAGAQMRIFYPRDWANNPERRASLAWAEDALRTAAERLVGLGSSPWPATDLVFTLLESSETAGASMATESPVPGRCNTAVYPRGSNSNEGDFKQIIAHEMFHCFQNSKFRDAMALPYEQGKWWQEGTAEYFSNVVYPTNNLEFKRVHFLDIRLKTYAITRLVYLNFYFFQYLGNTINDSGIINLLASFQTTQDEAEYQQRMNTYFNDGGHSFHQFGEQHLDQSIADTGGGTIPVEPVPVETISMDTQSSYTASAEPYKLTWFKLGFPENYKFTLNIRQEGDGIVSARSVDSPGAWGSLPNSLNTACGKRDYLVLATNTTPGSTFSLTINASHQTSTSCEPCLVGTWHLVPESLFPYMQAMLYPAMNTSGATGSMTVILDKEGHASFDWESSSVSATTNPSAGGTPQNVEFHGTGLQKYHFETEDLAATSGTLTFSDPQGSLNFQFSLDGHVIGGDVSIPGLETGFGLAQTTYECNNTDMTLTPIIPGKSVPGWQFIKEQPAEPPSP